MAWCCWWWWKSNRSRAKPLDMINNTTKGSAPSRVFFEEQEQSWWLALVQQIGIENLDMKSNTWPRFPSPSGGVAVFMKYSWSLGSHLHIDRLIWDLSYTWYKWITLTVIVNINLVVTLKKQACWTNQFIYLYFKTDKHVWRLVWLVCLTDCTFFGT